VQEEDHIRSSAEQDRIVESAVLQHLLALHPAAVTVAELVRELAPDGEPFARSDAIERAVRDLVGAGLLHRSESLVLPSRAALRFDRLLGE
jgi:hypothetical protein